MFKIPRSLLVLAALLIGIMTIPISWLQPVRETFFEGWIAFYSQYSDLKQTLFPYSKSEEKKHELEREVARLKSDLVLAKNQTRLKTSTAEVVYRSQNNWNEYLWINKGEKSIKRLSPVLSGDVLIGIIDYVGKNQSRVRLLSDSRISPSVRAKREIGGKTLLLAKGELEGSIDKQARSAGSLFKGSGFNYDFPDSEGPARDLRTGASVEGGSDIPIIKVDDILVTTGLDGIFPKGLVVAKVVKIKPLKEGDFYYEIEAKSLAGNLNDLRFISLIEPVGFDPNDYPAPLK